MWLLSDARSVVILCSVLFWLGLIIETDGLANKSTVSKYVDSQISPIVLVPGDAGSRLEAKLNKDRRVHYVCKTQSPWFNLWLDVHLLAPVLFDCLVDNMRLEYDNETKTSRNTPGVEIRPYKFGSLDGVEYLDPFKELPKGDYFAKIISVIETNFDLDRQKQIKAAPYDFRKAPNELEEYFTNFGQLIERTHEDNGGKKGVTLICHSMGCLNSLYLLNSKSTDWKKRHIRRLISLGAPWDGSVKALSALLFGDDFGIHLLDKHKLRDLQMTFPSLMYLFPREPTFGADRILVEEKDGNNFTLTNLDFLLDKMNLTTQREIWHNTRMIAGNLTAPKVELWCLLGRGIKTPGKIRLDKTIEQIRNEQDITRPEEILAVETLESSSKIFYEDGDGSVNLASLTACERFRSQQEEPVHIQPFEGVSHVNLLRGSEAPNFIVDQILKQDVD